MYKVGRSLTVVINLPIAFFKIIVGVQLHLDACVLKTPTLRSRPFCTCKLNRRCEHVYLLSFTLICTSFCAYPVVFDNARGAIRLLNSDCKTNYDRTPCKISQQVPASSFHRVDTFTVHCVHLSALFKTKV